MFKNANKQKSPLASVRRRARVRPLLFCRCILNRFRSSIPIRSRPTPSFARSKSAKPNRARPAACAGRANGASPSYSTEAKTNGQATTGPHTGAIAYARYRESDAIAWFNDLIAESPKAAMTFLVGADLAIVRAQGIEWRKPDHPAVTMYRKARGDRLP